ncbi:MAG: His-Xaa-Ser system protein HxsD [Tannerellaceae bacterium]|jgi:His-Xaa-Ser system protein HxsD|nr:His-Xaa-Ser system protein HxsD [Tannerellaceae bacterium]
MIDFIRLSENQCRFSFDTAIFSEHIAAKVLYWLAKDYLIYWKSKDDPAQTILLEKKDGLISEDEFQILRNDINQRFIDYKNRDIIIRETKNIRDILYIKAFANNDDFEDFNLIP